MSLHHIHRTLHNKLRGKKYIIIIINNNKNKKKLDITHTSEHEKIMENSETLKT